MGRWKMHSAIGIKVFALWRIRLRSLFRLDTPHNFACSRRRLDGDAPDLAVAHANNAFVPSKEAAGMVMAFEIPTAGCWELTAHYHGHRLTYVVLVGLFACFFC